MREIPVGKYHSARVDDDNFDSINQYVWSYSNGYAFMTNRYGDRISMHRLVLSLPKHEVDHINHNRLDNRRSNLRLCDHQQNMMNKKIPVNNTTGYKGVYKRKSSYYSRIMIKGRRIYLGTWKTSQEAFMAYCQASKLYHKEFGSIG